MLRVEADLGGLNAALDQLTQRAQDAARPAAQAGAQVFYDEVRSRVPVSSQAHATKGGKLVFQPGNLKAAIYQAYAEDESGDGRATYRISWNKQKAFYGRFVEFGTSRMPARPFLRPGYDAARAAAISAAQSVLTEKIKAAA